LSDVLLHTNVRCSVCDFGVPKNGRPERVGCVYIRCCLTIGN